MGWILSRAKASKNAKAVRILINAETPTSARVAIIAEKKNEEAREEGSEAKIEEDREEENAENRENNKFFSNPRNCFVY